MKRFYILLTISCLILPAKSAEISGNMKDFRDGALLLIEGIANGDRAALTDAAEILAASDLEEMADVDFSESNQGALSLPLVQFSAEYCDLLRKNNFELVALDPLESLRAMPGTIMTVTRCIAPGASATFSFEGEDRLEMVAVCSTPNSLKVSINSGNKTIIPDNDPEGYTSTAAWDVAPGQSDFTVTVNNPTDKTLSFAVALQ